MNLPNKLTTLRMIMIPFFVLFMKLDFTGSRYIALAIFIAASLTDMLDGKIARKYNLITDFGKFMDPLADKLLVITAMICLIDTGEIPSIVVMIIVAREFIISGFRLVAADNGIVIAASMWGKVKTVTQMAMIIFILFDFPGQAARTIEWVLIIAATILTVVSLCDYLIKNKQVLGTQR